MADLISNCFSTLGQLDFPDTDAVPEVTPGMAGATFLSLFVLTIGCYFWFYWLAKRKVWKPLCFQVTDAPPKPPVPTIALLLTGIWIALLISQVVWGLLKPTPDAAPAELPQTNTILVNAIGIPLTVAGLILIGWIGSTSSNQFRKHFWYESLRREFRAGLEIFLLAIPPTFLLGLTSLLWKSEDNQHVMFQILRENQDPMLLFVIFFSAATIAPFTEELMFRVVLLRSFLQRAIPKLLAVVIVSVIFAVAHGIYDALQLIPLSLLLAWSATQRQSYFAVVVAHTTFNSFMLAIFALSLLF